MPQQGNTAAAPPPPAFLTQQQPIAPPPPPMPVAAQPSQPSGTGFVEATGDPGRDALLASIRGAGGIGALKKVDKSQLDKPSVLLQEVRGEEPKTPAAPGPPGGAPGGGAPASLADALAAALSQRKNKVSNSDDEYDNGDDW